MGSATRADIHWHLDGVDVGHPIPNGTRSTESQNGESATAINRDISSHISRLRTRKCRVNLEPCLAKRNTALQACAENLQDETVNLLLELIQGHHIALFYQGAIGTAAGYFEAPSGLVVV